MQEIDASKKGNTSLFSVLYVNWVLLLIESFVKCCQPCGEKRQCKYVYTLGSFYKLYIRAEFSISFCIEDDMPNAIETAAYNFSYFY